MSGHSPPIRKAWPDVAPSLSASIKGGGLGTDFDCDGGLIAYAIQERAVSTNLESGPQGKGYQPDVTYTLEARPNVQAVAYAGCVRRLTPRECERLQGFPDDYTLIPWRKGMASDGHRYKALGNSMAVPVMRWIGHRIAEVDRVLSRNAA
nr:DNA cytosine methyltransferase [Azospirillum cavernae]